MASEYFNNVTQYCCSVTDFTPTTATVGIETHTFTLDVGTNGAIAFDNAVVFYDDLNGNAAGTTATGVYPSLTVDIDWPAAGIYYISVVSTFTDGSGTCTVKLDGTVEVTV